MVAVRFILSFIFFIYGLWLLKNIYNGITSGKLKHTDTSTYVLWDKNPIKFILILLILLFFSFICFMPLLYVIGIL